MGLSIHDGAQARRGRRWRVVGCLDDKASVGVERGVLLGKGLERVGQFVERMDRIRSARRHARTTIDAAVWIDKKLGGGFEAGFVFFGMNAVGRTGVHAEQVLDAGVGNHVSHRSPR